MGEAPGSFHVCSALKSLPKKVGDRLSHCNLSAKYRRLDRIFEKKMEAVKDRTSTRQPAFKTMNSIILKFPKFREQLRNIQSVFEQCDEDSNGTIDHEELKKCLAKLKVHLTEQEIDDLYHYCDIDGKEGIQYNEFIVLLCLIYLQMDPASTSNIMASIGLPQLEATFDMLVEVFQFLDRNGDGKLNKSDMIQALHEACPMEKSPTRITLSRLREMNWEKNGKVTFKEFLFALTKWVGIDTDDEK